VLVRGVRWRLMGSLLVVITAAIAVGAAVVGPLFLRAGGDSLVRQAVADATVSKPASRSTPRLVDFSRIRRFEIEQYSVEHRT
jgi:hypothetical protein